MRLFLTRILYFLIPLILISAVVDYLISDKLKTGYSRAGEFEVWNDIYSSNIIVDIAIYGSSRALVHIDPILIEKQLGLSAYNFGVDGHNFILQRIRHEQYFMNNPRPKIIILCVDEHSFAKSDSKYNRNQLLPYMLWELQPWEINSSLDFFPKLDYSVPLIRYFGKKEYILQSLIVPGGEPLRTKGFHGRDKKWNEDLESAKSKFDNFELELDENLLVSFQDFINDMKEEKIKLILVNTPKYIEGQNFIKNREKILTRINLIAEKNKIDFLDYSEDSISFKKELFYNSMHLNATGARLFTEKLISDFILEDIIKTRDQ